MRHLGDEILVPFLDGELSPEEARRCREHLSGCEACRIEARKLGVAWDLLDAMPEPVVPGGLVDAILARAEREGLAAVESTRRTGAIGRDPIVGRLIRWGAPLAAAAAIAVFVLVQPGSTSAPQAKHDITPVVDVVPPRGDVEQVLQLQDSLDVMNQYGDLIDNYEVLKNLDRILQEKNVTL